MEGDRKWKAAESVKRPKVSTGRKSKALYHPALVDTANPTTLAAVRPHLAAAAPACLAALAATLGHFEEGGAGGLAPGECAAALALALAALRQPPPRRPAEFPSTPPLGLAPRRAAAAEGLGAWGVEAGAGGMH
eukprot:2570-Prorocentrum_minimum.AAC.1